MGGFFVRDPYRPLGEVRIGGRAIRYEPVAGDWASARGCVHLDGDVRIAPRAELGDAPRGDLLQAGPILIREGISVIDGDGRRSRVDAGLLLNELARVLISFGAIDAINLDGGGSATLVHRGHLLNRPYSEVDQPAPESRPVITALLFE